MSTKYYNTDIFFIIGTNGQILRTFRLTLSHRQLK